MKVLVDTCVWSLVLRRKKVAEKNNVINQFTNLIQDALVQMIGPLRQEILSGITSPEQFKKLREKLSFFDDLSLTNKDYELAAEYFNLCRSKGIQGSNTDFLLCAVAVNHDLQILTVDKDFIHFSKHIPIHLH